MNSYGTKQFEVTIFFPMKCMWTSLYAGNRDPKIRLRYNKYADLGPRMTVNWRMVLKRKNSLLQIHKIGDK
jgi:hypothetical protein